MQTRQEVTATTAGKYRRATKKEKKGILDQFITATGYSRWQARFVLRNHGKRIQVDQRTVLVGDARKKSAGSKRPRVYDEKVMSALLKIPAETLCWETA